MTLTTYMREMIDRAKAKHAETLRQFGADPAEVYGAVENEPVVSWDGDGCSIHFTSFDESMLAEVAEQIARVRWMAYNEGGC